MQEKIRCSWAGTDPDYCRYHDTEWGVPLHDDLKLFEMLVLEGFQAGLSWITILRRRENFRVAFANWEWEKISSFTVRDQKRLMLDTGIIRNSLKIHSAINNAARFMEVRTEFGSFDRYIWGFTGNKTVFPDPAPATWGDIPPRTPLSDTISKDLKKRGFTFVGSVICYAYMQTIGLVNDHIGSCFRLRELRIRKTRA